MAHVVIMPKQGQSVESCIVTEFKKKVGDKVAVGDILFSYETDKASFDEESKVEGTVLACFFNDNDEIPCLTNVMVIGEPGESFDEFAPAAQAGAPAGEDAPSGTTPGGTIPPETAATLGTLRGGTGASQSEASGGVERSETVVGAVVPPSNLKEVLRRPVEEWKGVLVNDFEATVFKAHPELEAIKQSLYESGAAYAAMSGSGSAMFGIYKK